MTAGPPAGPIAIEQAFVAAERFSLWRTVARGLAHDLSNAAQMLALDPTPPRAREEAIEKIQSAIERLAQVQEPAVAGPTLPLDVIRDVQAMQRLQSGFRSTEIQPELPADLPAVRMSAADLTHVLLALVTIIKQAAGNERALVRLRARVVPGGVEIRVEDGGPGPERALRARAVEPLAVRTRESGAVAGFDVARLLARRAGGELETDDDERAFRLRLAPWQRRGRESGGSRRVT